MADSPDIKIQKEKTKLDKNESSELNTTSGVKRKKIKRSRWQRKLNISKRSLLRKIFSSKKEFDPEKDNILNQIIDGIADKIGDAVDSVIDGHPQENPLQELEELHPPKIPNIEEIVDELSKKESDDDDDHKKDSEDENKAAQSKPTTPVINKIRL
jgi:hypothetical protein